MLSFNITKFIFDVNFIGSSYTLREEKDLKIAKNKPLIAFFHGWKSSVKSYVLTGFGECK